MSNSDDDSMMIVSIEKHGISRVKGACVRAVLKERAFVDVSLLKNADMHV
jgi:hypothetical protein